VKKKPAKSKPLSKKALKAKRSLAIKKAWETRRKNERELERKRLARKRARAKAKAESFSFGANAKPKAPKKAKPKKVAPKKVAPKKKTKAKRKSKAKPTKKKKSRYWLSTVLPAKDVREAQKKIELLKRLYGIEPEGTPDERPDNFDMALIADQTQLTINEIYTLFYTPDGTTL
jgi:hypothetical protein